LSEALVVRLYDAIAPVAGAVFLRALRAVGHIGLVESRESRFDFCSRPWYGTTGIARCCSQFGHEFRGAFDRNL